MSRRYLVLAAVTVAVLVAGQVVSIPRAVAAQESVRLADGSAVALATPTFLEAGKRYAFTWPGGGPPQTYTVKNIRKDGWVQVQVAEENVDPAFLVPGQTPTRWLHVGLAISIQEMRPLPF